MEWPIKFHVRETTQRLYLENPLFQKRRIAPRLSSILSYHTIHTISPPSQAPIAAGAIASARGYTAAHFPYSYRAFAHTRFREAACLRHDQHDPREPLFFRVPCTR